MILRSGSFIAASALALFGLLASAEAASPPDTIVMAKAIDDMLSLDPADGYGITDGDIIANTYDRIMRYEPEDLNKLVGEVVESWTVSDDGKTFTFKVRPGQKFHSGNPVRAEDIAFSLRRVIALKKSPAFLVAQLGWTDNNVKDLVKATDDATLKLTIAVNYGSSLVLNILSTCVASVVDETEVMKHEVNGDLGNGWLKTHDAGSGPFILKSWTPNDSVVLEANRAYRLGAPKISRVILRHTPEAAAQRLLLEKGDADIARELTTDQIAGLAGNPDIAVNTYPSGELWYMALNMKDERLANPKVREAIRYLIDYQGMAASFLKGQLIVHQSFWPSGLYASLEDNPFSLDPAKAKQLLTEAGYPNGFDIQMDTPNVSPMVEIAQSVQHTMAAAGIKVNLVQEDSKQVTMLMRARKEQIAILHWNPDYLDPHANAAVFASNTDNSDNPPAKTLAWRVDWYIPELSAETAAAVEEKDADKRKQLYLDIQKKAQADGPLLVMFQSTKRIAARSNVKGFVFGQTYGAVFYRLMTK